jgi:hypothetical protein
VAGAASLLAVSLLGGHTALVDERLRRETRDHALELRGCDAEALVRGDPYARVYLAALDHEQRTRRCERRRFFVTARFDSVLALQPIPYRNTVHDARLQTVLERVMAADGPGARRCDYVIASEPELNTIRGNPLVTRLQAQGVLTKIASTGPYTLFAVER